MGYGGLTSAVQYYWSKNESVSDPPDYLNDLNAMHEAEKNLKSKQKVDYWNWLDKFVGNPPTDNIYLVWGDATFATAAQRAEAFLRTLNLWEES